MSGRPSCLSAVGRLLAGLAAALFVVLLPVTLLARNLALVVFDPRTLSQVVSGRLVESGMLRQVVVDNLFAGDASLEGLSLKAATQYLTPDERDAMIGRLLPDAWVQDQILRVTTAFFGWFDSPSTRLLLTVDTEPLRAQLRGEAAAGVIETIVESWPSCTLEDVTRMLGFGAVPGQEGFPFCEPPEPLRGLLVGALTGSLRWMADALPADLPVLDQDYSSTDDLLLVKEQVRMVRFVARWGILASLSLLGMIMAMAVRSWRGLTRWWGVPLLLGGLLAFVPVVLGAALLKVLLARMAASVSAIPALGEIVQSLGGAIGSAILRPQAMQALLFTGAGLLLLGLGLIGRRSARPTTTYAAEASPPVVPRRDTAEVPPPLVPPADTTEEGGGPSGMFG
jgi:hypothetical protein